MPRPLLASAPECPLLHLPSALSGLTASEIIPVLVAHTIKEVERELVLQTLTHFCENRTLAATVLGISIRTMRNKINEYAALGIIVPTPWHLRLTESESRVPMPQERQQYPLPANDAL